MAVWVYKDGVDKLVEPTSLQSCLSMGWKIEKVRRGRPPKVSAPEPVSVKIEESTTMEPVTHVEPTSQ